MLSDSARQSHLRVWALALPIILSNVSVPLVGVVDTAVMGHLPGVHNIGAVALGASIFSLVFWTFGFLRMACGGVIAQQFGARNDTAIGLTLLRYCLFGIIAGVVVLLLQNPILALCLQLMPASQVLENLTARYFEIRILSAPATFLNYVLLGTLIGLQRTGAVLLLQLLLNITNVILDLLFVLVLEWGIAGVASASIIAEYLALFAGCWLLRAQLFPALKHTRKAQLLDVAAMRYLLAINLDIFLRTLILVASTFYFNVAATRMGELILAANAILIQLLHLCAYALDGFAHAAETLTGQAKGAQNRTQLDRAIAASTLQALVIAGLMSGLLFVFGDSLLRVFTDQTDILTLAGESLGWLIAMPLVSVWSYQLDGIFIGTTNTRQMRNSMLISAIVFVLLAEWLQPHYGNHGLWLAFTGFSVCRAITLIVHLPSIRRQTGRTALVN